jgi:RNA polymerase sigma-70 factor (ECF subfamily)
MGSANDSQYSPYNARHGQTALTQDLPPGRAAMTPDAAQARLAQLLARSALGDRAAFAELYRAVSPKLFAVSLRIVRERPLAEEALQDSFVNIWKHAGDYAQAKSAPTTWMTAIVRNRSLDIVRRTREEPDVDDALAARLVDEHASPALEAAARGDAHSIRRCLDELDAEQRQTIALAFFHGLTHSELAAHLRRPLGTVKTHIRRGLLKLRDCLVRSAPGTAERR